MAVLHDYSIIHIQVFSASNPWVFNVRNACISRLRVLKTALGKTSAETAMLLTPQTISSFPFYIRPESLTYDDCTVPRNQ